MKDITLQEIEQASERLKKIARLTPLEYNKRLSEHFKCHVYIKREDLQEVRSYKIRGAYNLMSSLSEAEKEHGVVCASAGNHAQGVAYSAHALKIRATIFMPSVTPLQKINRVKSFGKTWVDVQLVGSTYDESYHAAKEFEKKHKAIFVHPFNDPRTIAGQGTVGKEIIDQIDRPIDFVFCAIGGGGFISGVSTYFHYVQPSTTVVGVEPKGSPSMYESFKQKKVVTLDTIDTFVDGAAVQKVGDLTYAIASKYVKEIVLSEEGKVCTAMIDLYQNEGIIAEPAGALAISALNEYADQIKGKTVVCVLSGGNNDILRYPEVMERSLVYKGLKHYFLVEFAQKPGQLKMLLNEALGPNDDIVLFEYMKKNSKTKGPALLGIELTKRSDLDQLLKNLHKLQIRFTKISSDDPLYSFIL